MSCEVFCCEIPEILEAFVNYEDDKYFKKLFSFLDKDDNLDCLLAGYFEKVLEMLFRRTTTPVIGYINDCGITLFNQFILHIDNYSITHIVQRLMLPHIPFVQLQNYDTDNVKENELEQQCNWSFSEETCALLCSSMSKARDPDVPSHISDLIITVLQLSPPDTVILTYLCQSTCIEKLLSCAFYNFQDKKDSSAEEFNEEANESISLAAISVLESLISRLCESLVSYEEIQNSHENDHLRTKEDIYKICKCIQKYLPDLANQLNFYNSSSQNNGQILSQSKVLFPRVGHRCLLLVKFVESIVRVNDAEMDKLLCETGVLKCSLDLMFTFELNSLLHLSVQRIILLIIDGGDSRRETQNYILVKCGLLLRMIETIAEGNKPKVTKSNDALAGSRKPILGHLLLIVQTLYTMDTETAQKNTISESKNENETTYMSSVLEKSELISNWVDFIISVFDPIMEKLSDVQPSNDFEFSDEYLPQLSNVERTRLQHNGRKVIIIGDDSDDDDDDGDNDDINENNNNINVFNNYNDDSDDEIDSNIPKNITSNENIDVGNFADFATFDSGGISSNSSNDNGNVTFDPFALTSNPLDIEITNQTN